jgi:uncharacterized protein involved in exopolysaccharide biosynthesis
VERRPGLEQRLDIVVAPSHPAAVLMVVSGASPGRLHSLDRPETYIGRNRDTHICIDEKSVSGRHAKIVNHNGSLYLLDLNSTNGTFVNGQSIREKELKHGDSVWIGETVFAFFQEGGAENSRTVALAPVNEDVRPHARLVKRPVADTVRGSVEVEEGASLAENIARLLQAYRFLKRHRFMLTLFALTGLILGAASIVFVPPPQVASCEVELRPKPKDNPVDNEWRQRSDELEFFSAAETNFPNGDLVRKTLQQLGEPISDSKVLSIQSRLELKSKGLHRYVGTYKKSYFDSSPHTAVGFLQVYVQNYFDAEIDKVLKVFKAEAGFLENKLDASKKDLADIEGKLLKFKEENQGLLPDQATSAISSRSGLAGRSGQLSADLTHKQIELNTLRERLKSEEPLAESKAAATQSYEAALAAVNQKLAEKRASGLGEEHPEVIQLKSQAAKLQDLINAKISEPTTDFERKASPGYKALRDRVQDLEMEVNAASRELGSVHGSLSKVDNVMSKLPQVEARLIELKRDQELAQARYQDLSNRWDSANTRVNLERENASARYEMPIKPTLAATGRLKLGAQRLGGGFAVFLVLGLGVGLLKELRRYVRENMAVKPEFRRY